MGREDRDRTEIAGFVDLQFHFQIIETLSDCRIYKLGDLKWTQPTYLERQLRFKSNELSRPIEDFKILCMAGEGASSLKYKDKAGRHFDPDVTVKRQIWPLVSEKTQHHPTSVSIQSQFSFWPPLTLKYHFYPLLIFYQLSLKIYIYIYIDFELSFILFFSKIIVIVNIYLGKIVIVSEVKNWR